MKTPSKGFGRIYVKTQEEVDIVNSIIKEWDDYEYGYFNKDLVTTFNGDIYLVYNGKFDELDLDMLSFECMKKGIFINYFFTGSYSNEEKAFYRVQDIKKGLISNN